MSQSSICRTLSQNLPLCGKDELAGAALTDNNKTLAVSRALTSAAALALAVVSALSSVVRYLEDDL